jgi:hypothetical protein
MALVTVAMSQQINDPAEVQGFVNTITNQRNAAMDQQAFSEARLRVALEKLEQANARIKELEAKVPPAAPAEAPAK